MGNLGWSKRTINDGNNEYTNIVIYKNTTQDVNRSQKELHLGDKYIGKKIAMTNLGLDIGTKTLVLSYRGADGEVAYITELNGYWVFERSTPFILNMLTQNKKRHDGKERSAKFITLDSGKLIVLGRDAEELAFAKNDTLMRPMAEGGIASDEDAMVVLSSIIHGMLEMVEGQIGNFGDSVNICYCTTAKAINKTNNIDYHERVIDIILQGYRSINKKLHKIKESHAIVLNMSPDATGIGISWGAGTVTVSYVKYGIEIFSFCWVGAGDWIDESVAMRYGYDPTAFKKSAKETPTTVARSKMSVDLTPGSMTTDRLKMDIALHYDVLISYVVDGIISGFEANASEARIDQGINVYMAGGTSSPNGFTERVKKAFSDRSVPFEIGDVLKADEPLLCVAEGCLKASEMF